MDPTGREQLEQALVRAAWDLLEYTGTSGVILELARDVPGESPAWVVAGSAAAIRGLARHGDDGHEPPRGR
jgi:hypothetical protein